MNAETWLTAQDAVDLGLADGILYEGETVLPQNIVNCVSGGIMALGSSGGLPDIVSMREAYRKQHEPDIDPEDRQNDWRDKARLELEKLRYF